MSEQYVTSPLVASTAPRAVTYSSGASSAPQERSFRKCSARIPRDATRLADRSSIDGLKVVLCKARLMKRHDGALLIAARGEDAEHSSARVVVGFTRAEDYSKSARRLVPRAFLLSLFA